MIPDYTDLIFCTAQIPKLGPSVKRQMEYIDSDSISSILSHMGGDDNETNETNLTVEVMEVWNIESYKKQKL